MFSRKIKGFSIIELVIVLLIIGILSLALMPTLNSYKIKANRSDAIKSLMALQIAQEKYRLNNTTYGASPTAVGISTDSIDGYYTLAVSGNTATAYTLTATAKSGTEQTNDTGCTTLTVTYANSTATNTPTTCWN